MELRHLSQTGIMVSWYWHCATVPTVLPLVFLFLACFSRALVVDVLPERHFFRGVRHRVRAILDVLDDEVFVLVIFVFVFKPLLKRDELRENTFTYVFTTPLADSTSILLRLFEKERAL